MPRRCRNGAGVNEELRCVKLSYDAIWQDILAMLKAHADIILVVAGAFMFLPTLAQAIYLAPPQMDGIDQKSMQNLALYYEANIVPLLALRLVTLLGTGTLLALLLHPSRPTVGGAIAASAQMLPSLFFVSLLQQLIMLGGFLLLIVPGLYVIARTMVSDAAVMAEDVRNPLRALARSFDLTRGLGWQVFGLVAILAVVTWITTSALVAIIGIPTQLLLPEGGALIARNILSAITPTTLMLVFVLLSASFYRALSAAKSGI
jgi:hypothetical protein